jgi:hypothetical protein
MLEATITTTLSKRCQINPMMFASAAKKGIIHPGKPYKIIHQLKHQRCGVKAYSK